MLETGRGFNPEILEDTEEVDVEQVISDVEEKCADFINPDTQENFEEIFDAARRGYSDTEIQPDWDKLFERMQSELEAAEDDDEITSILQNYKKKAKALV